MNDRPLVTVVMPNYNGANYLSDAIESVLKQTYDRIELIIVDDQSIDDSVGIIEKYMEKDNRVNLVSLKKNGGVAKARNIGIDLAKGDFIALLDSDDYWELKKIEVQIEKMQADADIVYCSYDLVDEKGNKINKPFIVPEYTNYQRMLTSSVISCSTAMVKANILKQHLFNTEVYHEDYLLWMDLLANNYIAKGVPEVLMHYRQIKNSRSNNKIHAAKERWNIYRNYLHLSLSKSLVAFIGYSMKGIRKYYG